MAEPYWLKVYFAGQTAPKRFKVEPGHEENNSLLMSALKLSRDCRSHAACLCTFGEELKLAIKLRNDKHHLACYPFTSNLHKPECRFYKRLNKEGGQGSYATQALSLTASGILKVALDYPLQTKSGDDNGASLINDEIPVRPVRGASNPVPRMSLLGLLHTLWETSRYNVWTPGMLNKRNSVTLGFHLRQEAETVRVGKVNLSEVLLTPAEGNTRNEQRNAMAVKSANASGQRLVVVAELARHSPDRESGAGHLAIKDFSGMPYLKLDDTRWKKCLKRFPLELAGWRAGRKVFAIAVTDVPGAKSAQVRQVALMMVSERFIPLASSYEGLVEERLVHESRSFIKPLKYDSAEDYYLPDFYLTDVTTDNDQPFPLEVWGMDTSDYLQQKCEKSAWYSDNYGKFGWWGWDAVKDSKGIAMPSFPAKEG
ncbi:DUF1173 family protein [Siccibacter colletis]|uniref:DUF1173 family protein n=1 Tax=Siccibacter colletis TaxID=1505757 RepID=UPI003CEDE7EF